MVFSAGGGVILGYFVGSFWCMFVYFLKTVQYFHMKVFTDVLSITLMVTTLKLSNHIIYLSAWCHFGVFCTRCFGACSYLLRTIQHFFHEILYSCFQYCSNSHYNNKNFNIISPCRGDHFRCMFLYVLGTIENFLMIFCTDVLSITVIVTTLFVTSFPRLLGAPLGIFGSILAYVCHSLKTTQ